ncbi:MFS transporter [Cupriavidus sp. 2SB]|uniref:MFS transporter n=1 Tax=Cupriavidus sp. 2SB TaxID=2502199 RepID=UPI0010F9C1FD|nr:MFS transporter [Cupriavidus sp. 2SB]
MTTSTSRTTVEKPWVVVGLGFLALALAFSGRGALSLVMPAWQAEFGWSRTFIASLAAACLIVMAVVAPFAGNMVDRRGPRTLLATGLLLVATGMGMVALAHPGATSWLLPVGFCLVAGVGFGFIAQHVVAAAIALLFDRRRGLATGIGTAGSTAGQLLMMPLLALLLQDYGWRSGFVAMAALALLLIPIVLGMLGPQRGHVDSFRDEPAKPQSAVQRVSTLVRNPVFHALFWSYLLCGFTTSGVIETHLMPYAAFCGFPPLPSATAYGVLSALNLVGMIGAGWLADKVHRPRLLAGIYLARAGCFILLSYVAGSYPTLILFAILFGLFDYSSVPVTAGLVADRLGLRVMGLAMGLLSAGHAIGGALGAFAGGKLFDLLGGYEPVWYGSVGLALIAALLVIPLAESRPRGDGKHSQPEPA